MRRFPVCLVAVTVCALAAPAASAESLWTEVPAKTRAAVGIPSVAPLVDKLEPAVLVIFTEATFDPSTDLPPGHPPLPEGMPLPLPFGDEGEPQMRGQGAGFIITPT